MANASQTCNVTDCSSGKFLAAGGAILHKGRRFGKLRKPSSSKFLLETSISGPDMPGKFPKRATFRPVLYPSCEDPRSFGTPELACRRNVDWFRNKERPLPSSHRPQLSVITATCRRPALLASCLNQFKNQVYSGFTCEHIVVSDGTDSTARFLAARWGGGPIF